MSCCDGNGSLMVAEPMIQRPMWGSKGLAPAALGVNFVCKRAYEADLGRKLGLRRSFAPIKNVRGLRKRDIVRNSATPKVEVDPQSFEVRADGDLLMCPPAAKAPLTRRFLLR